MKCISIISWKCNVLFIYWLLQTFHINSHINKWFMKMKCSVFWITPMQQCISLEPTSLALFNPTSILFKQPHFSFSVQKQDKSKCWRFFFLNKSEMHTSNWDFRLTNPSFLCIKPSMCRFHQTFPWFSYWFSHAFPMTSPINPSFS